jgi:hypothetical protein
MEKIGKPKDYLGAMKKKSKNIYPQIFEKKINKLRKLWHLRNFSPKNTLHE